MDSDGLLAAVVLVLIEESGAPVPLRGDVLMLAVAIKVRHGQTDLWLALLAMEAATSVAASLLYVAPRAGRRFTYRFGRFIHLTPERLDRMQRGLQWGSRRRRASDTLPMAPS